MSVELNHFHRFLEFTSSKSVLYGGLSGLEGARSLTNSICFSMPEFVAMAGIRSEPSLLRLPYPICWFEGRGPGSVYSLYRLQGIKHTDACKRLGIRRDLDHLREHAESANRLLDIIGILAYQDDDIGGVGGILFQVFVQNRDDWSSHCRLQVIFSDRTWGWQRVDDEKFIPLKQDGDLGDLAFALSQWIGAFLSLLNCSNVPRIEHGPPAALQKARKRRGKLPIFSYWTLDLSQSYIHGAHLGGFHTSPRIHLRRGHMRQYQVGRWCWVSPHAVGNKALGVVHKDYKMALPPQSRGAS